MFLVIYAKYPVRAECLFTLGLKQSYIRLDRGFSTVVLLPTLFAVAFAETKPQGSHDHGLAAVASHVSPPS